MEAERAKPPSEAEEWDADSFERYRNRHVARLLRLVINGSLIAVLLGLVNFGILQMDDTMAGLAAGLVLLLICRWLAARGSTLFSSVLLISVYHLVPTYLMMVGYGLRDEVAYLYPLTLLLAGLFFSGRGLLVYLIITLGTLRFIVYGETMGWVDFLRDPSSLRTYTNVVLILITTALVVHLITTAMRRSLERAWEKEHALEKSNLELEARNAELERFTYTVSHDLKSPLVTISGYLGLLKRHATRGDLVRFDQDLDRVQGATTKMQQLLADLLSLSRIGRIVAPPQKVSLDDAVARARQSVAGMSEELGARIEVQGPLPDVYGDPVRVVEVFQNLIENALKFHRSEEPPVITITAQQIEENVEISVSDNGVGIQLEYQQQIFGLFERLDPSIEGTGVGLALVHRIVTVHGGEIWVESAGKGRGSTFWLTLPSPPAV